MSVINTPRLLCVRTHRPPHTVQLAVLQRGGVGVGYEYEYPPSATSVNITGHNYYLLPQQTPNHLAQNIFKTIPPERRDTESRQDPADPRECVWCSLTSPPLAGNKIYLSRAVQQGRDVKALKRPLKPDALKAPVNAISNILHTQPLTAWLPSASLTQLYDRGAINYKTHIKLSALI